MKQQTYLFVECLAAFKSRTVISEVIVRISMFLNLTLKYQVSTKIISASVSRRTNFDVSFLFKVIDAVTYCHFLKLYSDSIFLFELSLDFKTNNFDIFCRIVSRKFDRIFFKFRKVKQASKANIDASMSM